MSTPVKLLLAGLLLLGLAGGGVYYSMFRVDPAVAAKDQESIEKNKALDEALGLDDDFDDLEDEAPKEKP